MKNDSVNEAKLKTLLSIDHHTHSPAQRSSMIMQGINWLGLVQAILVLFVYHMPVALFDLLQSALLTQKEKS